MGSKILLDFVAIARVGNEIFGTLRPKEFIFQNKYLVNPDPLKRRNFNEAFAHPGCTYKRGGHNEPSFGNRT